MAKTTLQEIDILANLYNKTKDEKYKIKWYQLVKEFADGRIGALDNDIYIESRGTTNKNTTRIC
jgi:hypothetical protein|tara:strand:+ start:320 stop:511 length:192 start_codon:yes stop_codon:yes gene_type:complete